MVKPTITILQQKLQNCYCACDHFVLIGKERVNQPDYALVDHQKILGVVKIFQGKIHPSTVVANTYRDFTL